MLNIFTLLSNQSPQLFSSFKTEILYPFNNSFPFLLPTPVPGNYQSISDSMNLTPLGSSYIGEGNGNPLQCSCQENPRDGGAWWAAVYGITQSRTQLKRFSSSSSSICDGEGDGTSLQYSCLENLMDGGTWWVAAHGVSKSQT